MSSSAYWLTTQMNKDLQTRLLDENRFEMVIDDTKTIVYCPTNDEYEVTSALVQKASNLGVAILAYPTAWCKATTSAFSHGKKLNVEVMPFGKFLAIYG